jgi:hypothetical protein
MMIGTTRSHFLLGIGGDQPDVADEEEYEDQGYLQTH